MSFFEIIGVILCGLVGIAIFKELAGLIIFLLLLIFALPIFLVIMFFVLIFFLIKCLVD